MTVLTQLFPVQEAQETLSDYTARCFKFDQQFSHELSELKKSFVAERRKVVAFVVKELKGLLEKHKQQSFFLNKVANSQTVLDAICDIVTDEGDFLFPIVRVHERAAPSEVMANLKTEISFLEIVSNQAIGIKLTFEEKKHEFVFCLSQIGGFSEKDLSPDDGLPGLP